MKMDMKEAVSVLFFLFFGILGIALFSAKQYPPVFVSIFVFCFVAFRLIAGYRRRRIGPLALLFLLCYALPFIHIVPYLWFDFRGEAPAIMWGLAANPYMTDQAIVELTAFIGAVGAAGLAVGVSLSGSRMTPQAPRGQKTGSPPHDAAALPMPIFLIWMGTGVILSWLFAPEQTIFTAAYTEGIAISQDWNFSSIWMFSYAFLLFCLADAILEPDPATARWKRRIFLVSGVLVVVYFQLLRGDRESLPFALAAMLMFFIWGAPGLPAVAGRKRSRETVFACLLAGIFFVSLLVGAMRFSLAGADLAAVGRLLFDLLESGAISLDNLLHGTWSAVLLTPLSVAGDHLTDLPAFKYGGDYLDLLLSLPPGFVADFVGYARPIDSFKGPAWEMTYGLGGVHAVVLPFRNFGMIGVFFILMLWGCLLVNAEKHFSRALTASSLAFLGVVAMALPHWLWYGEKNIINALIVWLILSLLYRISHQPARRYGEAPKQVMGNRSWVNAS